MKFRKYHGAGNDFLIAYDPKGGLSLSGREISHLCDRHLGFGADGLMILGPARDYDFRMEYYNSDGSGGMMCGNGGRCIVACASDLGIEPFDGQMYNFIAPDGPHRACIVPSEGSSSVDENLRVRDADPPTAIAPIEALTSASAQASSCSRSDLPIPPCTAAEKIVRLSMKDVRQFEILSESVFFVDTGTRHCVRFVDDLENYNVDEEGRKLRRDSRFAPGGVNADFVSIISHGSLAVRTFEKGVESETLACGTGIVAAAIAAYVRENLEKGDMAAARTVPGRVKYEVRAAISRLSVDFLPGVTTGGGKNSSPIATDVWLTGPAAFIGECLA